jgi:molecular chaperone HtpG
MNKEVLGDLLLFYSSHEDKLVTLAEYKSRLHEDDRKIYYAAGESIAKIKNMPQVENMIDKGNEVLFLTDYLDEFTIKAMNKYEELEFVNVQDTKEDEEDDDIKKVNEDNKELLDLMKSAVTVTDIKFSDKLKNHPVALTSTGEISLEMEKVLKGMPNNNGVKASKVLLINNNHPVYEKLISLHNNKDDDGVKNYTNILYNMALLINGLSVDNPNELTETICNIISK